MRLPLATAASASILQRLKQQRGKYGREIAFVFRHTGILATSGIEAAQYFAFGCIETFFPIYLNETRGYSTWSIGLLFTAQIVSAAFTKPIMGRLSDRVGRIPMITGGLILGGLATALLIRSNYYVLSLILMAVFGLGLATVTASTSAFVADLSRSEGRGGAMGVLSSIMDIGQSLGPIVTGLIIAASSYTLAFTLVGLAMIVISLGYGLSVGRMAKPHRSTD